MTKGFFARTAGLSMAVLALAPPGLHATVKAMPEAAQPADETGYSSLSVFTRALQLIRQDYVDDRKISFHDLTYGAMRGMLSALDPHSQFMDPR